MERPTKVVVNCETGVQEVIELTDAEIAELEAAAAQAAEAQAAAEAEAAAKAAAKQAAQDKLKALGLSDLEVAALVGA
jgi:ribosomal protein S11